MGVCFICDAKLFGERTRVSSSITPHSNMPYAEKISELLGEEFVVILTPADHMCKRCTSLLTHMDKLENDLKLVKNAMISYIQKKYGLLPPDQPIRTLDVVNGHLKTDEIQLEPGQKKVPSGLTVKENPSPAPPLKMLKTPQSENSSKLKIYKCGFCTFQSKELGHVRFHMRSHMNKKTEGEKTNQTVSKTSTPLPTQSQKKRLYRCQVCSLSFDSRISCLDHIQLDHNQGAASTSNEDKESKEVLKNPKSKILKPVDNEQSEATTMDVDNGQQNKNKGSVDTDKLLIDNTKNDLNTQVNNHEDEQEEPPHMEDEELTQGEDNHEQVDDPEHDVDDPEPVDDPEQQQEAIGDAEPPQEEESVGKEEMEVDGENINVKKSVEHVAEDEEKPEGDLDIESMLAAIHNDNPTHSEGTQNAD